MKILCTIEIREHLKTITCNNFIHYEQMLKLVQINILK